MKSDYPFPDKCEKCIHNDVCYMVGECLNHVPGFECDQFEEKRPRGTWIDVPKYKGFYVCSKCLERLDGDFERFDHWEMKKENFCPVCGSDNRKRSEAE